MTSPNKHHSVRRTVIVFPALAIAVSVSCGVAGTAAESDSVARPTTASTIPKGGAARSVSRVVATVSVAKERPAGYRREAFRHWVDDDGDGCNTREEVLIAESTSPAQVDAFGCKVIAGNWYSPYDGVTHSDPSDLDIDHLVPLKEAWDSGAHSWSAAKRRQFANDLSDARSLIAVTAGENRSKGDKDPSNWMPDRREYWCTYISDWVAVKARWGLSMDQSEAGRVRRIAASCSSTTVPAWGKGTDTRATTPANNSATAPSVNPTPVATSPITLPSSAPTAPTLPTTSAVVAVTTTVVAVATSTTTQTALPEGVPGRFCTPEGAKGTYNGDPVVCSRTKADGTPYVDNRARWVRV